MQCIREYSNVQCVHVCSEYTVYTEGTGCSVAYRVCSVYVSKYCVYSVSSCMTACTVCTVVVKVYRVDGVYSVYSVYTVYSVYSVYAVYSLYNGGASIPDIY